MEKNNNKVCKICNKWFSTGKAMGGHMRSHLAKLPIPPKPETVNSARENSVKLTHNPNQSPSSSILHPQKKPTQNFRSLKHNFFPLLANPDKGSELEPYPKNPTRKRSKCHHKFNASYQNKDEAKQISWIFEPLPAVEAARSLLMLSRDKWPKNNEIMTQKAKGDDKMEAKDGGDNLLVQTLSQAKFKCEMCPKMFQSYQALGGHKANHKKIKNPYQDSGAFEDNGGGNNSNVADQKVFECPYCSKVFKSAQALGGHKKVHISNTMVANNYTTTNNFSSKLLDLNFPATEEDEEVSHIKCSSGLNGERVL